MNDHGAHVHGHTAADPGSGTNGEVRLHHDWPQDSLRRRPGFAPIHSLLAPRRYADAHYTRRGQSKETAGAGAAVTPRVAGAQCRECSRAFDHTGLPGRRYCARFMGRKTRGESNHGHQLGLIEGLRPTEQPHNRVDRIDSWSRNLEGTLCISFYF